MGFWNREGNSPSGTLFSWNDLARISRKGLLLSALKEKGQLYSPEDLELMLNQYAKKNWRTCLANTAMLSCIMPASRSLKDIIG